MDMGDCKGSQGDPLTYGILVGGKKRGKPAKNLVERILKEKRKKKKQLLQTGKMGRTCEGVIGLQEEDAGFRVGGKNRLKGNYREKRRKRKIQVGVEDANANGHRGRTMVDTLKTGFNWQGRGGRG